MTPEDELGRSDGGAGFFAWCGPLDGMIQAGDLGRATLPIEAAGTPSSTPRPAPLAEAWSSLLPPGKSAKLEGNLEARRTPAQEQRDRLWELREAAAYLEPWEYGRTKGGQGPSRISLCGKVALPSGAYFARRAGEAAGVYGVQTCGRAWTCAACRSRAAAHHVEEIGEAWRTWHAQGGRAYFATFTVRHSREDAPIELRLGLAEAWARMTSGAWWHRWRKRAGAEYVRALDVTHGHVNGWHLHYHVILFTRADFDETELRSVLAKRWEWAVKKSAILEARHVGNDAHAVHLESAADGNALGEYLAKLGLELAGDLYKVGDRWLDHRTPWEILADWASLRKREEHLDDRDRAELERSAYLWREFSAAMRGSRWFAWSQGLRDLAKLGEEITDEQAAELESEGELEVCAIVPMELRKRILRYSVIRTICGFLEQGLPLEPWLETWLGAEDFAIWQEANSRESLARFQEERRARARARGGGG